jgi:8-oxo-dGTP diphosphatase
MNTFTASAYLMNGKATLLVFHKRFNMWVPVGGRREGDEKPHETVLREVGEETGIVDVVFVEFDPGLRLPGMPAGLIGYHEHDVGNGSTHMNFAFAMRVGTRNITPCDEFTEAKWFTSEDMDDVEKFPMPPNVRKIMEVLYELGVHSYPEAKSP